MYDDTRVAHRLFDGPEPWVTLDIGEGLNQVSLFVRDLGMLATLSEAIGRAHRELAEEMGLLPNGEPCSIVDAFGSIEWNEHDHDQCLESMVDEPVPYLPTKMAGVLGSVA